MPDALPVHPLRIHPQRDLLANEVHARPTMPLEAPQSASHLAVITGEHAASEDHAHLVLLCRRHGVVPPAEGVNHFTADLGTLRLRWERHTEFVSYTFFAHGAGEDPFARPPLEAVPRDWLATLPGHVLVAMHVAMVQRPRAVAEDAEAAAPAARLLARNSMVGSRMGGGIATGFTDCHIHADGFGRVLVVMHDDVPDPPSAHRTGRLVQRLLEIETYRTMALLGLPHAREAVPVLGRVERGLAEVSDTLAHGPASGDDADRAAERALLDRLAGLAAEAERLSARTSYRFDAAAAYAALVARRVGELREERLDGLRSYGEFMERQLQPAIRTCEAVSARQERLSRRLARACQLLRARVEMTLQEQNRDLLHSLDRRANLQLRLQETVEGLSVFAISYYAVSLIGHMAGPLTLMGGQAWPRWLTEVGAAVSVPIVLGLVWLAMRRMRHRLR
jgi:uncharacterized membrane-anchored protein